MQAIRSMGSDRNLDYVAETSQKSLPNEDDLEKKIIQIRDKIRRGERLDYQKHNDNRMRSEQSIKSPIEITKKDLKAPVGIKSSIVVAPLIFPQHRAPQCYSSNLTPANTVAL